MRLNETIRAMHTLARLEADAAHAYGLAVELVVRIGAEGLRGPLEQLGQEHERHYRGLSHWLRSQGNRPPLFAPDPQGKLSRAFDTLGSTPDAHIALMALRTIERTITALYEKTTLRVDLPNDLYAMLVSAYAQGERNLNLLEGSLARESVPA